MVKKVIDWIKSNKLSALLIAILVVFVIKPVQFLPSSSYNTSKALPTIGSMPAQFEADMVAPAREIMPQIPPILKTQQRKVVTNSNFSLLVKNVTETLEKVKNKVATLKGYVVNSNIDRGVENEDATVQIRIPVAKVEEFTTFLRSQAVRVVSENVNGNDITDQYYDSQMRLTRLEKTKAQLEEILDKATKVDDMLMVQNQIFSIQDQIDTIKGRLAYMDGASSTVLLSVSLSTDELSLPYAPENHWRPNVIFKEAVRSLLATLQKLGTFGIWLVIYLPLIVTGVLVYKLVKVVKTKLTVKKVVADAAKPAKKTESKTE